MIKELLVKTAYAQVKFDNPLKGKADTFAQLLTRIIQWLLGIAGTLALLAIIVGGIMYILSFGNDQKMANAKRIVVWAVGGLAVIALAFVIVDLVATVLGV